MKKRNIIYVAIFILALFGCEKDKNERDPEEVLMEAVSDTLNYLVKHDDNVTAILFGKIDTEKMLFASGGNILPDEIVYTASPGSKGLTSYMIHKENIDVDQTINEWFPLSEGYPKADIITIRMLLNHTSGIPDFTLTLPDSTITAEGIVDFAYKHDVLSHEPGEYWCYSNTNFIIAGVILEKVTGKTYQELMAFYFGETAPSLFLLGDKEFEAAEAYMPIPFNPTQPLYAGGLMGTSVDVLNAFYQIYNDPVYQEMLDYATVPSWGSQCSDCICDLYIYADKYGLGTAQYTFDKMGVITGADGNMGVGFPQLFTKNGEVYFINTIMSAYISSEASLELKKAHAQAVFDIIN